MVSPAANINRVTDDPRPAFEGGGGVRFWGVAADKAFALRSCASASLNGRHCIESLSERFFPIPVYQAVYLNFLQGYRESTIKLVDLLSIARLWA